LWLCSQAVLFFDKRLAVITLEHAAQHFALFEVPPHADEYRVARCSSVMQ
jgi:hypothetical protein